MPFVGLGSLASSDELDGWSFYGLLNFGVLSVDNGGSTETYFGENGQVPSRVGAFWKSRTDQGTSVVFNFETGLGFTQLSEVSPSNDDFDIQFDMRQLRKLEVIFGSDQYGRVSLGQGSMASDGASGVDLSGTSLAHGPAIGDLGGATEFLLPDETGSGVLVSDVFDDLDGPRRFRVRYDTPAWNGLRASLAYGQEVLRSGNDLDYRDVALTYTSEFERFVTEAAVSYEWIDDEEERALASASILDKPTGLNGTIATGHNEIGDGRYVYIKLGIARDAFTVGKTAVSIEHYAGDDLGFVGSASDAIGIGFTQNLADLNLDLVATIRRYGLSSSSQDFTDIDVAMIGARWRF